MIRCDGEEIITTDLRRQRTQYPRQMTVHLAERELIDRHGIEAFVQRVIDTPMDSAEVPQVDGIVIARHGKLVLEAYFHGYHRDLPHDTRSAAKSLTATLIGAAMKAGADIHSARRCIGA